MSEYSEEAVYVDFLSEEMIPITDSTIEQLKIFIDCLRLHAERDKLYGAAWKKHGALANLLRMSTKLERLLNMFWIANGRNDLPVSADLDDAFDLINYTAFFLRQAKKGLWTSGA
jgi:hypothetical protein